MRFACKVYNCHFFTLRDHCLPVMPSELSSDRAFWVRDSRFTAWGAQGFAALDLGFATGFSSKKFSQQGCPREAVWCLRKMLAAHEGQCWGFSEKL